MKQRLNGNPTVSDVAREAGVATMTVSRVVNGEKYVSEETAARVRTAIAKLGYQRNEAARILKGHPPQTIGLIVPDMADPFFSTCAHAVQQLAAQYGYMTLICASERQKKREVEELGLLLSRNIAGVLIVPCNEDCISYLKEMRGRGIPVVLLDRTFPGVDAGQVMVENDEGTQKAINHLIAHGHKNILCVGYDSHFNSVGQRISGYKKAMKRAGLTPKVISVKNAADVGARALKRLRGPKPPTALFTTNNVSTTAVLQMLRREGIKIPQTVALIGFDDFDLASLLAVPLTAVRQPAAELGRSATRMLLDWVQSGAIVSPAVNARITLPTELIIRRSCGCEPPHTNGRDGP
jgi:LacI family transcriptional regulator